MSSDDKNQEECYVCGKKCDSRHLQAHIRTHTDVVLHECEDCGKIFPSKKSLLQHCLSHMTHYVCDVCNKKFRDPDLLTAHKCNNLKENTHVCETCGKSFAFKSRLLKHSMSHLIVKSLDGKKIKKKRTNKCVYDKIEEECYVCGKICDSRRLQSHIRTHTDSVLHECQECGRRFSSYKSLQQHRLSHVAHYVCEVCNQKFRDPALLTAHTCNHLKEKKHACETCGKSFLFKSKLLRHLESHLEVKPLEGKIIKKMSSNECVDDKVQEECYVCGKMCESRHLPSHIRSHTDVVLHECEECGSRFSSKKSLRQHWLRHLTHYVCEVCNKKFRDPDLLKGHVCSDTIEKKHVCETCGKSFVSNSKLLRHSACHLEVKPFACDVCGKRFTEKGNLNTHFTSQHSSVEVPKIRKVQSNPCDLCLKVFPSKRDLSRHKLSHTNEKPYECDICGKKFARKDHMQTHKQCQHSDSVTYYQCEKCGKDFNRKSNLKVHLAMHERQERGEPAPKIIRDKIFTCELCLKSFPTNTNLQRHQLSHTQEKPHSCEHCDKRFAYKSYLKVHELHHSNTRPFKCDECDKCFYDRKALNQHIKRHKDPTIICSLCSKGFYSSTEYDRHYAIHTNVKHYICDICHKAFSQLGYLKKHYISHTKENVHKVEKENNSVTT